MATNYGPPDPVDPSGAPTPALAAEPSPQAPPQFIAPPRARRRGRRTLAIVAGAVAFSLLVLGGGAAFANASLSSTYGPGRAVTDYLAAMSRGDVAYMLANGNYPKVATGSTDFYGSDSVTAMMNVAENRSIRDVRVTGVDVLDSSTSKVTVAMTWAGKERSQTYVAHQDASRPHYLLYHSWRIDIPASTISVVLPPQGGAVGVDGVFEPPAATVSVIQGFHDVAMETTDFYAGQSMLVDATGDTGSATFSSDLSSSALAAAAQVIKDAFNPANISCNVRQNFDCPNHKYVPAPGTYAILEMPGGNVSAYQSWIFTFTGDPTAGMKLVVGDADGKISATGTCSMRLLVDGSKKYAYHGTWHGTLTWSNGGFAYDGTFLCDEFRG